MKKKLSVLLITFWIFLIFVSSIISYRTIIESNDSIALNESRAFFEQIVATREWNSMHGGVYAPVTEHNRPNEYLDDSLRDIVSTNGLELTKINPAYMTRQIAEITNENYKVQFKITSLNPIRPQNKADSWESNALKSFEEGFPFAFELIRNDTVSQYRYMAPLQTKHSCLQCHAIQGYQIGEIRGGISVTTPTLHYIGARKTQIRNMLLFHSTVLIISIIWLFYFYKKTNFYFLEISNKNKELTQLNTTKDKLFSIIAHDLKSPVGGIVGLTEILMEKSNSLEYDSLNKFIISINAAAHSTNNLLSNLLDWARSQTGNMIFEPVTINLKSIIIEVVNIYILNAKTKNIHIEYTNIKDIEVYADKNMLMIILRNLLSNAIKFSNFKGVITISSKTIRNNIEISVSDNGIGIDLDIQRNLFCINDNITSMGTNEETGTGLGLILCKEFVEKHGGKIWVESVVGKGSDFKFSLPIKSRNV